MGKKLVGAVLIRRLGGQDEYEFCMCPERHSIAKRFNTGWCEAHTGNQ